MEEDPRAVPDPAVRRRLAQILTTWPFVASVAVLFINDFWLKHAMPGWLSGKLSDFAGIAIVTWLLLATAPRAKWQVYGVVTACFTFWKSPVSQSLIDGINAYLPFTIGRVVDYTDLIALSIMPVCARVIDQVRVYQIPGNLLRRLLLPPVAALTSLALIATPAQLIHKSYSLQPVSGTVLAASSVSELIAQVAARHEMTCQECVDPKRAATYSNRYLRLSYDLVTERKASIRVLKGQGGMPFVSDKGIRMAEALHADLQQDLANVGVDLEFIPPQAP